MPAVRFANYTITKGSLDEVLAVATGPGGIAELYRSLPGYRRFEVVDLGDGMFASLTTWGSRTAAEDAATAARGWVKEHLSDRIELVSNAVGDVVFER